MLMAKIFVTSVLGRSGNIAGKTFDRNGVFVFVLSERVKTAKQLDNDFTADIFPVLNFTCAVKDQPASDNTLDDRASGSNQLLQQLLGSGCLIARQIVLQ